MSEALYSRPSSVEEALRLAKSSGQDCLYVGGGTDIEVYRKQGLEHRSHIIDLSVVSELRHVGIHQDRLVIGAMCTLDEIVRSESVRAWSPLLTEAARAVASPTIRYTATVAGNLLVGNRCTFYNQSSLWRKSAGSCLRESGHTCLATGAADKCYARNVSDLAPALIVLDSEVEIRTTEGSRVMPLLELYVADGLHAQGGLPARAVLTAVRVAAKPQRWFYRKLRQRESIDFTSLTVAGALTEAGDVRVCINGISAAPVFIGVPRDKFALDDLQVQARRACKTVDNDLMPLKYRRYMLDLYIEQLWHELVG